jgi:hypothetical protein
MKHANLLVLTAIALSLAACTGSVPLEGKSCPCATGFVCCVATNQCLASGEVCAKKDGGVQTPANADASADAPNLGVQNAVGRPCDLTVDAGPSQNVYNASASECPSSICLKPAFEPGTALLTPSTQSTCTGECTYDSDCDGELRDPTNAADQRCEKGFACGIPFVKGPLSCKKLCMCKDFLGPAGVATPIACQGIPAGSWGSEPTGSISGVGQQTDIYIAVAPTRQLDLVFMVDNSPSMAPKVAKMNAQFPGLINALKDPIDGSLPDLRVAIIDSDLGTGGAYSSGSCGPKMLPDGTSSMYGDMGRFQMIGASACGVNNPSATYLETKGNVGTNFTGDISTVFQCLAGNLGTLGCGEEHQLQAFEFALATIGGLGNDAQRQMLRPLAYLGLVFLTDEDDCSAATNDGMFGDKPELRNETASLRCYSRSHSCGDRNLANDPPPGYPTSAAFTSPLSACKARTDACSNATDGNPPTDTSVPTSCSPLKDYKSLANEIKGLKNDPDNQILVAGIFGWPNTGSADPQVEIDNIAKAQYKIDKIPNPNAADTAHPQVWHSWPVCYDANHMPADANTYDPVAAGWGATAGLRNAAFIDEFGANGLKFSICDLDFSASMQVIGYSIAKRLQNLCVDPKMVDTKPDPGVQPDCRVVYRMPEANPAAPMGLTYVESPASLPQCDPSYSLTNPPPDSVGDCWKLDNAPSKCPSSYNNQVVTVLRTASEIAAGPLSPGTSISMQCQTCPNSIASSALVSASGCDY